MTKKEYIAKFSAHAAEMVLRPEFTALLETAREENMFLAMAQTEISVLQLSGAALGWHKCLEFLKTAHLLPQNKPEKAPVLPYEDPEKRNLINTENKKK